MCVWVLGYFTFQGKFKQGLVLLSGKANASLLVSSLYLMQIKFRKDRRSEAVDRSDSIPTAVKSERSVWKLEDGGSGEIDFKGYNGYYCIRNS